MPDLIRGRSSFHSRIYIRFMGRIGIGEDATRSSRAAHLVSHVCNGVLEAVELATEKVEFASRQRNEASTTRSIIGPRDCLALLNTLSFVRRMIRAQLGVVSVPTSLAGSSEIASADSQLAILATTTSHIATHLTFRCRHG